VGPGREPLMEINIKPGECYLFYHFIGGDEIIMLCLGPDVVNGPIAWLYGNDIVISNSWTDVLCHMHTYTFWFENETHVDPICGDGAWRMMFYGEV